MLGKKQIHRLFEILNRKLAKIGAKGEVGIVGGAVMCLVFNARSSTKDVGGIFEPSTKIRELAREIADEEGIAPDWLNDGAKAYIQGDFNRVEVLEFSNLTIWSPEPKYILAMKCLSARVDSNDGDDIRFLVSHLEIKSAAAVLEILIEFFPQKQIPAKTKFFVEEILEKKPF